MQQYLAGPRDLFEDLSSLSHAAVRFLEAERWLDAFLTATAMSQIVDDYAHRDIGHLQHVARHISRNTLVAQVVVRTATLTSATLGRLVHTIADRTVSALQREVAELVDRLAAIHVAAEHKDIRGQRGPVAIAKSVTAQVERAPATLRRSVLRLPACFTTFDQQPEDCQLLVRSFADRWPDRGKPLAVIGVRTSGSYLAPLCAAYLRTLGFENVEVLTWRSGQRWLPVERRRLNAVSRMDGLALVVDDPPTSGNTLGEAAEQLERLGIAPSSIILLFQVFDSPAWWPWPRRLEPYQQVVLPWERWTIQGHLREESVKEALTDRLVGVGRLERVERLPLVPHADPRVRRSARRHVQARYRIHLIEHGTGKHIEHEIYAKGTGLGYFGAQSLAIARQLEEYVPQVYGIKNGLMFRQWVPADQRLSATPFNGPMTAEQIASYVAARRGRLAVSEDLSQRLTGRDTLWEQGAHLLTQSFGRLSAPARLLVRRSFRNLFRTAHPSIVDGSTAPSQWFIGGDNGSSFLKVDFDENVFWKATPGTYDPVADLANSAVHHSNGDASGCLDREFSRALRETYTSLTGEAISRERWFLHQVLNIRKCQDRYLYDYGLDSSQVDPTVSSGLLQAVGPLSRDLSRLFERYLGDLFLGDTWPRPWGPFCAVDIDGVLETPWLSFASTTPAGAMALRALARHGYRTLLATGRSLEEVRERCEAYRLAGGVAEYGCALYNHLIGKGRTLLDPGQKLALESVRSALENMPGVHLDLSHRYSVRAYRIVNGRKSGLDRAEIEAFLTELGQSNAIQPIWGTAQTDFVPLGIDKGVGLEALTSELGRMVSMSSETAPLALAIGDTEADASMFRLAVRSFAPANADAALCRAASNDKGLRILARGYQAGLVQAVTLLLGHRPGACPICRPPSFSAEGQLVLDLLRAQDVGRWGKLGLLVKLMGRKEAA